MMMFLAKFPVKIAWKLTKVALVVLLFVSILKAFKGSMHKEESG